MVSGLSTRYCGRAWCSSSTRFDSVRRIASSAAATSGALLSSPRVCAGFFVPLGAAFSSARSAAAHASRDT
jgi:hypothetical protein